MFVPKATDNGGHKGRTTRQEGTSRVRKLVALVEKVERLKKVKKAMEYR